MLKIKTLPFWVKKHRCSFFSLNWRFSGHTMFKHLHRVN